MKLKHFSLLLILSLILCGCESSGDNDSNTDTVAQSSEIQSEQSVIETENFETTEEEMTIDIQSISTDDFISQCNELWHDDIFFSESNLTDELVKLDLFVEEEYYFSADDLAFNAVVSDFFDSNNLLRNYYNCGVSRSDGTGYVGGQIQLYFQSDSEYTSESMRVGDHIIVYGQIIEYSTNTWDGYNACGIIPKYIENNGQ